MSYQSKRLIEQLIDAADNDDAARITDLLKPYASMNLLQVLSLVEVGHIVELIQAAIAKKGQ